MSADTITQYATPALWVKAERDRIGSCGSRYYDGSGEAHDVTGISLGTNDLSFWGWVRSESGASGQYNGILDARDGAGFEVRIDQTNGHLEVLVEGDSSAITESTADSSIDDDTWHFFVLQLDRDGLMTLYLDDMSSSAFTKSISETDGTDWGVGQNTWIIGKSSLGTYLQGNLCRLGLAVGTRLSESQRLELYNYGNGAFWDELSITLQGDITAYWNGAEYDGTLYDQAGNSHDGTDNSGVSSEDGPRQSNAMDASGNGRHGTLSGFTDLLTAWRTEAPSGTSYEPGEPTDTAEEDKIAGSDRLADDRGGMSIDIDGDTAILGADHHSGSEYNAGAAYVFTRSGSTWSQQQKLTGDDTEEWDVFGVAVAVDGDTAVVGAHAWDGNAGGNEGAVYVFTRSGGTWTQQQVLTPVTANKGAYFGRRVALKGDVLAITATEDNEEATDAGAAYIFTRSGGTWSELVKLTASDASASDKFGSSIDLYDDTVVVGAHLTYDGSAKIGSAYVFTYSGSTATQQAKIVPADGADGDLFGYSVAIHGDRLLVGSPKNTESTTERGAVYVYARSSGTWSLEAKLIPHDIADNDRFGWSVAYHGAIAAIGAYGVAGGGAFYVYTRHGSIWHERSRHFSSDTAGGDYVGYSVAIDATDTVATGAYGEASDAGAGYIFVVDQYPTLPDRGAYSLRFDGSQHVDTGDAFESVFQSSHTVTLWVKLDDGRGTTSQYLWGSTDSSHDNSSMLAVESNGRITAVYDANGNRVIARSNDFVLPDGQTAWCHVVFRLDDTVSGVGGLMIFLDGAEIQLYSLDNGDTSGVTPSNFSSSLPLFFGARNDGGSAAYHSTGLFDDVRVYDRALTDSEISSLAGGTELQSTPVAHYTLDDGPCGPPSDKQMVAEAVSKEGNRHRFTQSTRSQRCTWSEPEIEGAAALAFDGASSQFLTISEQVLSQSTGAVFILVQNDDYSQTDQYLLSFSDTSASEVSNGGLHTTNDAIRVYFWDDGANFAVRGDTSLQDGTPYLLTYRSDGSTVSLRVNGTPVDIDDVEQSLTTQYGTNNGQWWADMDSLDAWGIGGLVKPTPTGFVTGHIGEIVAYDGVTLSDDEVADIESEIMVDWDIGFGVSKVLGGGLSI